ncbi:MAG: acyl-CoA dehydrogenase family protein [Solirubrobacterales bacterium]|nr:acyl-CoA dehydrogenase family protein [Solirubrobacterales bacterium]
MTATAQSSPSGDTALQRASGALPAFPPSPLSGALANNAERFSAALARADKVAATLRQDAAERDAANADPRAEVELLRENDLLQAREPVAYGGDGLNYAQAAQIIRRVARGDTNVGHLIGYHFADSGLAGLLGTKEQGDAQSRRNGADKLFWGGIQNPRGGSDVVLSEEGDHYVLNGRRSFASNAKVADINNVTASFGEALVFVNLPNDRPGINYLDNWNNIGQRLTASGGVELHNVRVERDEILGPDPIGSAELQPYHTLVTPHWQLAFVNFYIGTAEGAIQEAFEWTRANAAPWETSGVEAATDDAYILETAGELVAQVRAAALLADRAGEALQTGLDTGISVSPEQRAEAAVAVYEAKYLATKVALETTSRLFEIQGARATTAAYGFDRHWRNVRTHTVHDPVAYKAREVGDWALNQRGPEFSLYR